MDSGVSVDDPLGLASLQEDILDSVSGDCVDAKSECDVMLDDEATIDSSFLSNLGDCRLPSSEDEEVSSSESDTSDDSSIEDDGVDEEVPTETGVKDATPEVDRSVSRASENGVGAIDSGTGPMNPTKRKRKKQLNKDGSEKRKKKKKSKPTYQRRNIRGIMKESALQEHTLTAQKEEQDRMKRLLELKMSLQRLQQFKSQDSGGGDNSQLKSLLLADNDQSMTSVSTANKKLNDTLELWESDDECVVIDGDVTDEDTAEQEDPENSGCHVNDEANKPDSEGRVLVNCGHPGNEPDIFLAPQLANTVKPHQIGGIRFLYDNLIESVSRFEQSSGFGCILAHSMGLGKTIQVISFIDIFFRHTSAKTVLCIVPINTIQNWLAEFNMWLPTPDQVEGIPEDDVTPRKFQLYVINDSLKTVASRARAIDAWFTRGGVLLMGYEMYRLLASRKTIIRKPKKNSRKTNEPVMIDLEEEDKKKELQLDMQTALLRPGPDLIICDEGHRIKNSLAGISQALKNIRTRRRVVLTGYPLQNNLVEYWCMVDFVRPDFLGSKSEFTNMFERPITNAQCMDSTPNDLRVMKFRAHVLHSLLVGFVQRRSHLVLHHSLPPKQEHVLLVRMSPIQRALYKEFMELLNDGKLHSWASLNPLKAFSVCCKIWNHPDILHSIVEKKSSDDDLDLDVGEKSTNGKKKTQARSSPQQPLFAQFEQNGFFPFADRSQSITYDWAEPLLKGYTPGLLENGGKMVLLLSIIEESLRIRDKVLVFSQSLFTLNLIEEFLAKQLVPGMTENWSKNRTYCRLDGSTPSSERERLINNFNDPDNTVLNVFLLSTRAGCLGINLIGANRVVVFDASWNPCHDCQALCRVYRYGQTKPSFIYRLVADHTMEKKIYDRQVNKQGMSDRVVDELQPQNNFTRKQVDKLLDYEDVMPESLNRKDWSQEYSDPVLANTLHRHVDWITKEPFKHESLLVHRSEQKLTSAEKRLAKQSYESDKKMNLSSYSRGSYNSYLPKPSNPVQQPAQASQSSLSGMGYNIPGGLLPNAMTPVPGQQNPSSTGAIIKSLQRPGVSVSKVITTTDIVIPGIHTVTGAEPPCIPAGRTILVIKTPKGVYIRTEGGQIFAVRSGAKKTTGIQSDESLGESRYDYSTTTSTVTTATGSHGSLRDGASGGDSAHPLTMLNNMLQQTESGNIMNMADTQSSSQIINNRLMSGGVTSTMAGTSTGPYNSVLSGYQSSVGPYPLMPLNPALTTVGSKDDPLVLSDSDQEPNLSTESSNQSQDVYQARNELPITMRNFNDLSASSSDNLVPNFDLLGHGLSEESVKDTASWSSSLPAFGEHIVGHGSPLPGDRERSEVSGQPMNSLPWMQDSPIPNGTREGLMYRQYNGYPAMHLQPNFTTPGGVYSGLSSGGMTSPYLPPKYNYNPYTSSTGTELRHVDKL